MKDSEFSQHLHMVGAEIRRLRSANGLSQEAFADLCGLDRTYIGGVERGERNVSIVNLLKLSNTLDVSLSELLTCLDGGEK